MLSLKKTTTTLLAVSGLISASLFMSAPSMAESAASAQHQGASHQERHGEGKQWRQKRMALGMNAVKEQLQLNTNQQQLWQNAETLQTELRTAMKANARPGQVWQQALASNTFNPRTAFNQMDALQAQRLDNSKKVRDAWLTVYESLDQNQQSIVIANWKTNQEQRPGQRGRQGHRPAARR